MATPMYPVKSSQISYIGYEPEQSDLFITFKNGSTYMYKDVPKYMFDNLKGAKSVGEYFSNFIKNSYEFVKVK